MNTGIASIPHNRPSMGVREENAALEVIRNGQLATGKSVSVFENNFCAHLGLPTGHAVAVSSGSAALYLALWALGAKGKKVAFPAYTCSSLRWATQLAGGHETLVDTEADQPNADLDAILKSTAELAIVPHMFGIPQDLKSLPLKKIVIEDCSQALGATVNQQPVGLRGAVGIFSFYATKIITSGGHGGMVVSKDKKIIDAIRDYVHFDQPTPAKSRFNFLITDLQASIGDIQLSRLAEFVSRRKMIFEAYKDAGLALLGSEVSPTISPIRFRAVMKNSDPIKIIARLKSAGISSIVPIEDREILGPASDFPCAHKLSHNTVSLPIYPTLDDTSLNHIIKTLVG
jgi:perosamine synthetase